MTAFDRFDPFEQRIVDAIDDLAAARRPDYLDDVLRAIARSPQRARWTFPGRWLPIMDTTFPATGRSSLRPLFLVAIAALVALAALAVFITGARPSLPLPTGPARNGVLVYPLGGDIWSRAIDGEAPATRLFHAPDPLSGPSLSPDGTTVVYVRTVAGTDQLWAGDVDGANARLLIGTPIRDGYAQFYWSPDSRFVLLTALFDGPERRLYRVPVDGSGPTEIALQGGLIPWDAVPSPLDAATFLLRAQRPTGVRPQGLYIAHLDGSVGPRFDLPGQSSFGDEYTLAGVQWSPDGRTIAYNGVLTEEGTFTTAMRVHLVDADGTNDRTLPGPADTRIQQAWPGWSPDGTQLVVQRFVLPTGPGTADASGWIAVLPADGSSAGRDVGERIDATNNPDVVRLWSPDGRRLIEWVDATARVYVVDPVSGEATEMTLGDDVPDWQRLAP